MALESGGILLFRKQGDDLEVLLAHPAGPIWSKKDFWSIPKGELDEGEDHLSAAKREFQEEVGVPVPNNPPIDLGTARQSNRKLNYIWAVEGDMDPQDFSSNSFTMEWPPKTGQMQEFPENDRVNWFPLAVARQKIFKSQQDFIDRLATHFGLEIVSDEQQQSLL